MRRDFIAENRGTLVAAAKEMATAFEQGGQLLTMGNGGSATDAQDMTADFLRPVGDGIEGGMPALSLTNDIGVVTAVGNDVGFENIFLRQVIAYGRAGDILVGFSTSGQSPNLIAAFDQANKIGLCTIGITGYDGGKMAQANLDHCFIVRSTYVLRIQEVHATIYHTLWHLTHHILREKK